MHPREKKCTPRENVGYAYEKRAPPYVGMGPRMVNSALSRSRIKQKTECFGLGRTSSSHFWGKRKIKPVSVSIRFNQSNAIL